MLKTLAISILLAFLLALVGFYIASWFVAWQLGATFTGIIAFLAAMQWALDYLKEHSD